jgi:lysophospholipase L1-like esterase
VLVPAKEEVYSWVWKGRHPWSTGAEPSGFSDVLRDICAREDLLFLDLKPYLVRESRRLYEASGQLLYWFDDTHLNTAGNTFTAPVIYSELVRKARPFAFLD